MELKTIQFYNDKGNVAVNVRNYIRKGMATNIANALEAKFEGVTVNANGGFHIPVAVDAGGEVVYAVLDLTITTRTPETKVEKKSKGKAKTPATPLPSLFGEDEE